MEPAVSIITPTFNHERFIGECLDSVLAQTFTAWEQIVIDDGSTDGTAAEVARRADPRIRYVRQERLGAARLPETYNRALALCRAPLIAILEGDDLWPSDKLASMVPAFDDPGVVLAYGRTAVFGAGRSEFPARIPSETMERAFPAGTFTNTPVGLAAAAMLDYRALTFTYPVSVILRRAALERIGGFQRRPGLVVTDHPTFLRMALEGRFHYIPRTMGFWRVHRDGMTVGGMDHILRVVHREVGRFRAEEGPRLPISPERWREITQGWELAAGWMSMREARRLLVEGRWPEARPHLRHAATVGHLKTVVIALAGLLGTRLHFTVEPFYRLRGRPWFRRGGDGAARLMLTASR